MSKGSSGRSRWYDWRWDRTPEATARPAALSRTVSLRAAKSAVCALAFLTISCSRTPAEYDRVWSLYTQGDLAHAGTEASRQMDRLARDRNSPWYWRFRLLAAEALTAQSRISEAE